MQPLVTVICLCFNHSRFLKPALDSVLNQTYSNLEIIVIDDFSTDNSCEIIAGYAARFPQIKFFPNEKNLGVCSSFNRAFALSNGKYIVDFATDDVLLPNRIAEQVALFEKLDQTYGVIYSDSELIDDTGNSLGNYYKRDKVGKLLMLPPQGDVFAEVLRRHFISPPTIMVRREVYEKLGGYDQTLAYEDFDFWVRSSRLYKYYFQDRILTKRRIHAAQLSQQQYKPSDKQIFSTIKVCRKALKLIKTEEEKNALVSRINLELNQAVFTQNQEATSQLYELLKELKAETLKTEILKVVAKLPLPLFKFRQLFYKFRYGR